MRTQCYDFKFKRFSDFSAPPPPTNSRWGERSEAWRFSFGYHLISFKYYSQIAYHVVGICFRLRPGTFASRGYCRSSRRQPIDYCAFSLICFTGLHQPSVIISLHKFFDLPRIGYSTDFAQFVVTDSPNHPSYRSGLIVLTAMIGGFVFVWLCFLALVSFPSLLLFPFSRFFRNPSSVLHTWSEL